MRPFTTGAIQADLRRPAGTSFPHPPPER
jgi:hypothetical protein